MLFGIFDLFGNDGDVHLESDMSLEHGRTGTSTFVFHPKGHGTGHWMAQFRYLQKITDYSSMVLFNSIVVKRTEI